MTQFKISDLVYPKKMSWDIIFNDLEDKGITPSKASMLIGAGRSSLQRWRSGTEPKHSIGVSILKIHTRYCGEELTNQRITEAR